MRHLEPADIVDAAENTLDSERREHLRSCVECRNLVRDASAVLNDVRSVEAAEPSPLFWDHFSTRVRSRIDEAPQAGARWRSWNWAPAGLLAGSVVVAIAFLSAPAGERPNRVTPRPASEMAEGSAAAEDSSWALLSEATDEIGWEDAEAAGLDVRPGAAEHAIMQLSDDQQRELERLLQDEMTRLKS